MYAYYSLLSFRKEASSEIGCKDNTGVTLSLKARRVALVKLVAYLNCLVSVIQAVLRLSSGKTIGMLVSMTPTLMGASCAINSPSSASFSRFGRL